MCYLKTQFLFEYKDQSVTKIFRVILSVHIKIHRPVLIEQDSGWGPRAALDFQRRAKSLASTWI
jgi:hypothetical protein